MRGISAPKPMPTTVESRRFPPSRAGTYSSCRFSAKMADSQMKWRTSGGSVMFLRTTSVDGREAPQVRSSIGPADSAMSFERVANFAMS